MPRVALYYPSWGIGDPCFMFDALLYWDRLTCIVPVEGFPPGADWPAGFEQQADRLHEQFVTGIAPSDEVKERVHKRLEEMLDTPPPEWCSAESLVPGQAAVLGVRKLSSRTIDMLIERGWLAGQAGEPTMLISQAASGILLGTLAEEISSDTMPPITDQPDTFRATCNGLLRELQSQQGLDESGVGGWGILGAPIEDGDPEPAVALRKISRLGIDPADITPGMLGRLYELRQRTDFDEQREHFRGQVDTYLAELRKRPAIEHGAIHDHWQHELSRDRTALKRSLRAAGLRSVIEKEGIVATVIGTAAGAGALAAAGPAGLVIGLGIAGFGIADSTRRRRRELRDKHWTSWLTAPGRRTILHPRR